MMIKVRIAPSPTGPLHVGTARSALFNYIFARKHKGAFILRIEDTDITRADTVYENDIREGLSWLGLQWDEFYRESERTAIYKEYLKKLYDSGSIFWCSHSKIELTNEKETQMKNKAAPRHICAFRDTGRKDKGGSSILRFKNNHTDIIEFSDIIRGKISFNPAILGDFSVARSFDSPLYNFAVAIDDSLMEISHVIRGEDLIASTPKQILLLNALKFNLPEYAHIPLLLNKDRSKLSKRKGPTSINQYRKEGYLADAMVNFLALLGWHPTKNQKSKIENQNEDIFLIDELIENFDLKDVQKGGAIFDIDKLNWMNGEYVRKKSTDELARELTMFLKPEWQNAVKSNPANWLKIVALEQLRLTRLSDIESRVDYFFEEPQIDKENLGWKNQKDSEIAENLNKLAEALLAISENEFVNDKIKDKIKPLTEERGTGEVLWPMRYALTGKKASPSPFEVADVLGKGLTISRLKKAIEILRQ